MVRVRPSLLNAAIRGTLPLTVISARPLPSVKVAEGIVLSPKVRVGVLGETTGSLLKTIRNLPGSVAMLGFTGAVKFMTRRVGPVWASCAVK